MKEKSGRQLKASENLKRLIATAFNVERIFEHLISNNSITISEVNISPDLRNAKIYALPLLGDREEKERVIALLNEHSYQLKSYLSKNLYAKSMPKIHFVYDDLFDKAAKMEDIIADLD